MVGLWSKGRPFSRAPSLEGIASDQHPDLGFRCVIIGTSLLGVQAIMAITAPGRSDGRVAAME